MTDEQRQGYKDKGYYENGCYEIAKVVFNRLYDRGIRSRSIIEHVALETMMDYCESQGWNANVTSYHIKNYGLKSLMYWITRHENTLIE
jgi:hypothetical protein